VALATSTSRAQFDFTVNQVQVVQAIPEVTLTAGKSAIVRATIGRTGTVPAGTLVDGLMRVFVDGVEASFSPVYSENGPFTPPAAPNPNNLNDTLNFVFLPPESSNVVLEVEINPSGPTQVAETNFTNNVKTTPALTFKCIKNIDTVYVPIDYRPTGGTTPNLPPLNLLVPGAGDNMIQGVYPAGDWEYRLVPGGSKLWTSSVASSGSALISALAVDRVMMNPVPTLIYGFVPGGLSYNGVSTLNGTAAMGNTQNNRYQRTFAHEFGHLFGRNHINNTIGVVGVDVEHHLNITESLPQIHLASQFDIMVAGLLTPQAWVYNINYNIFANHSRFQCPPDAKPKLNDARDGTKLLISGTWNRIDNTVDVRDLVSFPGGEATEFVPVANADLVVRAYAKGGRLLGEFGMQLRTIHNCGEIDGDPHALAEIESFTAVLPGSIDPEAIDRLTLFEPKSGRDVYAVARSATRPQVDLLSPIGRVRDRVDVAFLVEDADNADTKHYVRYSPDGRTLVPVVSASSDTSFSIDMSKYPAFVSGKGFFEVLVTDGLNTTRVETGGMQNDGLGNTPPSTFILTPDPGKSFPFGATVILHSSGWDAEDFVLEGNSIVWTSSIDGQIATGRVTTVQNLSVGTHVITVTATDSLGAIATDTETLTITPRALPGEFCQTNLGFAGPGTGFLKVCGGDLSTGTQAAMTMSNAPSTTSLIALFGTSNSPVPILGGMIVPVPVILTFPDVTTPSGTWALPVMLPGGGGPATFFAQVVYIDGAQTFGLGFSNAVQVDILP
jgi:hypothetical protein